MKRLLLDTHVLLWWLSDDPQLGQVARKVIGEPRNQVYISAASTWEISIKRSLGKLSAPDDMDTIIEDEGFDKLSISVFHGEQAGFLPGHHKDPFDRMLVAQAQAEGLVVITNDEKISRYGVRVMNARN